MLPIKRKISNYNYSSRNGQLIKYIVLHYTGNSSDSALANANYFNTCDRNASAHYFVDDNFIYQVVEDSNASWAVGGGIVLTASNKNSISIEMCTSGNYKVSTTTENNAIELVKYLMKKYDIDINHVVRHYDCNTIHKICPNWSDDNWARWINFKKKLSESTKYKIAWNKDSNGWFYSIDGTNYYKDCWQKIDGEWYSFNSNGYARQSVWLKDKGKWYWLKEDCSMACNEWLEINNKWYRFNSEGAMLENKWYQNDKCEWFYLGNEGAMVIGWYSISDKQYYFNKDGVMQSLCIVDGKTLGQDGTIL